MGCCIFRRFPPYFPPSPSPAQAFPSPGRHPSRPAAYVHRKRHVFSSNPYLHAHTSVSQKTPNMNRSAPTFPKTATNRAFFYAGEGSESPLPHRSSHADDSRPAIESRAKSNFCAWSERIDAGIPAGPAVQGVGDGGDRGNRHPHDRHPGDDHGRINRHDPPGRGGRSPLSSGPRPRPPRSRQWPGRRRPRTR
ncbi:hypothetical protein Metli_0204 [Methanofollis liminatans DSM 4140]|uniref:Uncharacterized protein n=1 Tax=Methanofollis liminatans DSM 4140 TaxID=28892 RepID=J1AMW1_9EURY|nr:hypothetical protein Metli_0204 [Methanofollis liminatans DSM 4140]